MLGIFLDTETTGLDCRWHHAIDIGIKILDLDMNVEVGKYQTVVKIDSADWERRDPESMLINGYTWEQICLGKEPLTIGKEIIALFTSLGIERGKAVFICQNPGFDRAFFSQLIDIYEQDKRNWPYHWLDLASIYWTVCCQKRKLNREKFPELVNLSKNEIAKAYNISEETEPHRAMNGVDHLIQCYQAILIKD